MTTGLSACLGTGDIGPFLSAWRDIICDDGRGEMRKSVFAGEQLGGDCLEE